MNFDSGACYFISIFNILASIAQQYVDYSTSFKVFEFEGKFLMLELKCKVEFLDENFQNYPWCAAERDLQLNKAM